MRYLKEYDNAIDSIKKSGDKTIYDAPKNTPIWAVAYSINDDTKATRLISKPTKGEITAYRQFVPYKKNTNELRTSGEVYLASRMYADTYDEAVELFNELIDVRIAKLQQLIDESNADKIQN